MELRWAYELLEVMPGADRGRVHASYRELARRWHPDRLQADPAGAWRGAERLRHVNAAYAAIRAAGFPAAPAAPAAAAAWPAWQPWTTTTWPHERAAPRTPAPTPVPRSPRPAPAPRAQPDEPVSLLWALLWLVLLVLTLGLLDGLALDEHADD